MRYSSSATQFEFKELKLNEGMRAIFEQMALLASVFDDIRNGKK
jgi:hypothetical protein